MPMATGATTLLVTLLSLAVALLALRATLRAQRECIQRAADFESRIRRVEASVARIEAKQFQTVISTDSTLARSSVVEGQDLRTLIAVPDLSRPGQSVGTQAESTRRASAAAELARRFAQIWELDDSGISVESIAKATARPVGQVELVLNLRRRLAEQPSGDFGERASA